VKRVVYLAAQLVADDDEGHERRHDNRERDRRRCHDR
jgi:hypothetical protein